MCLCEYYYSTEDFILTIYKKNNNMQQYNKVLIKMYLKNICTLKEALRFFFGKSNIKLNKREIVQSADLSEYTEH